VPSFILVQNVGSRAHGQKIPAIEPLLPPVGELGRHIAQKSARVRVCWTRRKGRARERERAEGCTAQACEADFAETAVSEADSVETAVN
jgi:hypothetical protein